MEAKMLLIPGVEDFGISPPSWGGCFSFPSLSWHGPRAPRFPNGEMDSGPSARGLDPIGSYPRVLETMLKPMGENARKNGVDGSSLQL